MSTETWTRAQLVAANEDAAEFFRRCLLGPEGDGPRRYLVERGFEALLGDTRWTVGYAPAAWTRLRNHLTDLGYQDQTLLAAGLTRMSNRGTPIDCFRDRITFGIRDTTTNLVGFTGRCSPEAPSHVPKYLNTQTTDVYDKSRVLFGLGEAASTHVTKLAITEGPLDAIAVELSCDGDEPEFTPLALCGTAFTHDHGKAVASLTPTEAVLAFDDDQAGTRARLETYRILRATTEVKALQTSGHGDVAELCRRRGRQATIESLICAVPAIDAIVDAELTSWPTRSENAEVAIACLRSIGQLLGELTPKDMARHAVQLQRSLRVPTTVVTRELADSVAR